MEGIECLSRLKKILRWPNNFKVQVQLFKMKIICKEVGSREFLYSLTNMLMSFGIPLKFNDFNQATW